MRGWIAWVGLSAVTAVAGACSDGARPKATAVGGSPDGSAPLEAPREAGAGLDAGDAGAGDACNPIPNTAPPSVVEYRADPPPTDFAGGPVPDGTYFLTRETHYGEPTDKPSASAPGITLTLAGSDMKYGKVTAEGEYVPVRALVTFPPADAGASDAGVANQIEIRQICPVAGSFLGPQPYTMSGADLTIGFGLYTVTYTRAP